MILEKLQIEKEKSSQDKADLFDFYHKHWDELVSLAKDAEAALAEVEIILAVQQDSMHGQDFDTIQECRDKIWSITKKFQ